MDAVATISLGAAAVAVAVAVGLLLVLLRRERRLRRRDERLEAELAAARAESAELRGRLATLERATTAPALRHAEFLITDAGQDRGPEPAGVAVPDGLVLSATLGEPVVRAMALAHGVRRALSAESRNRIRFAMRQEVRRTRRRRKREMKQAWRRAQAEERRAQAAEPTSGDAA